MYALVVPTARPERIADFLRCWGAEPFAHVLIIEDGPRRTLPATGLGGRLHVFSWEEIDRELAVPTLISRQDSAIRSFGFWQAWRLGCSVICTLDDDCAPLRRSRPYLLEQHLANLFRTPRWVSTVPGLRVRGLPYENVGVHAEVMVNVGLWAGHADRDAVTTLAGGSRILSKKVARRRLRSRVMPSSQYFPLCGMNLAFRREVACLMYFPPMGRGSPYGRFDDIWCGLVLQRICRHLGYALTAGRPLVWHQRASAPLTNLAREAPGIRDHERLWEVIDGICLSGTQPLECMVEVGQALCREGCRDEQLPFAKYLECWGRSILGWCQLFASVPANGFARPTTVSRPDGSALAVR